MEQFGVVTAQQGEIARVQLQRHLSCEGCDRCGIFRGNSHSRDITIEALNPVRALPGQRVKLETADSQMLFLSFMLYIVPLFGLVGGIFAWHNLARILALPGDRDLAAIVVGLALMGTIYFLLRAWDRKVKDNPAYKPEITAVLGPELCDQIQGGKKYGQDC